MMPALDDVDRALAEARAAREARRLADAAEERARLRAEAARAVPLVVADALDDGRRGLLRAETKARLLAGPWRGRVLGLARQVSALEREMVALAEARAVEARNHD